MLNYMTVKEEIAERYGVKDFDIETVYQDITVFPLLDDEKRAIYVAAFLNNGSHYSQMPLS